MTIRAEQTDAQLGNMGERWRMTDRAAGGDAFVATATQGGVALEKDKANTIQKLITCIGLVVILV